jgi:hypothetical protein
MKWEEVEVFYPYLVRIRQFTKESTKKQPEGRRSRAPTVKAAVEASILLRSVRKLRREEVSRVRCCV